MRWSLFAVVAALAFGCSSSKSNHADASVPDAPMPTAEVLAIDGGEALVASTTAVNLGHLGVREPGTATVIITNRSLAASGRLTISPSKDITVAGCTDGLGAGESCTLTITAIPTSVGAFSGTITITADAGPPLVIAVVARLGFDCEFSVNPPEIGLGNVQVGIAVPPIRITVTTGGDMTDLTVAAAGADVSIDEASTTCTSVLAGGASCVVAVKFLATTVGSKREEVTIAACGLNGKVVSVPITANAVTQSPLVITPSTPQAMGIDTPATFVITNAGNTPTGLLVLTVGGANAADFVTTTTCTALAASATCSVTVVFAPAAAGQRVAVLTVTDTGPGASIVSMPLSGTGPISNPGLSITSSSSDLGKALIGTMGAATLFTVTNVGNSATGTLKAAVSNPELVLTNDACTGVDLPTGGTCTVSVALKPATYGAKSGTLTVSGTISTPAVKVLTGTGVGSVDPVMNPSSLDFGVVSVGTTSPPQTVTVRNYGGSSATLTMTRQGDFAVFPISENKCTEPVGPGATCSFKVSFAPTEARGSAAAITVTDGTVAASVTLAGTGYVATSGPLVISPSNAQSFATSLGTTSSPVTFTVTNVGGTTTGALLVALTGPNAALFSATSACTVLAAGASCDVSVVYRPSVVSVMPAAGSLTVTDSGPGAAMVAVALTGQAYDIPGPIITSTTSDLGTVLVGTIGPAVTFTIKSYCDTCLGPLSVAVSSPELVITDDTCTGVELPDLGTCTLAIALRPATRGAKSATLQVAGTKGSPAVKTLTGTAFVLDAGVALDAGP